MKKYFSIIFLLLTFQIDCQSPPMDQYGRSPQFTFGTIENPELKPISIECNKIFEQLLKRKIPEWGVRLGLNYKFYNFSGESDMEVSKDGKIDGAYGAEIIHNYSASSIESNHVYAIGKLDIPIKSKRKIKWLDYNLALGEETDYEKFKKLETLTTQGMNGNELFISPKNFGSGALRMEYPGSPFFWKNVTRLRNLKSLQFDLSANYTDIGDVSNIYSLNPPESDLFSMKNLSNIHFAELQFLPVNFYDFEKLNYLYVEMISTPELVNLALVMYGFGKDTSQGNWNHFLKEVDLNQEINIPVNGKFETFYKNGTKLCEGTYKDGIPHGSWAFWYKDGKLAQKRSYTDGQRDGLWLFFSPSTQTEFFIDTVVQMTYNKGQLIKLVSRKINNISYNPKDCNTYENNLEVEQRIEFDLTWKSAKEVTIRKKQYSIHLPKSYSKDTLKESIEIWGFSDTNWSYHFEEYCLSSKSELYIKDLRGKSFVAPHFSCIKYKYKDGLSLREAHWTIDLENCYQEYVEYENNDKTNEIEVTKYEKNYLSNDDWSCKPQL